MADDNHAYRRALVARVRAVRILVATSWGPSHDARAYFRQGMIALAAIRSGEVDRSPLEALRAHDVALSCARQCYGGPTWGHDTARAVSACYVLAAVAAGETPPAYHVETLVPESLPDARTDDEMVGIY